MSKKLQKKVERTVETVQTSPYSFVRNETTLTVDPQTNDSTFTYKSFPQSVKDTKINQVPVINKQFYQKDKQWFTNDPETTQENINSWVESLRSKFLRK